MKLKEMVEDMEEKDKNELQENVILEKEDDQSDIDLENNEWKHKIKIYNLNKNNNILHLIIIF